MIESTHFYALLQAFYAAEDRRRSALGGRLRVSSPLGAGTTIRAVLPFHCSHA